MKLPRDLDAKDLSKRLSRYGYSVTRQTGSHLRLSTTQGGEHHLTIPAHGPLRVGTLNGILSDVAAHLKKSKDELLRELFHPVS
jgi:predicted RNA binding protein YcfA (HicA-like mRNA interferase family)